MPKTVKLFEEEIKVGRHWTAMEKAVQRFDKKVGLFKDVLVCTNEMGDYEKAKEWFLSCSLRIEKTINKSTLARHLQTKGNYRP